MHMTVNAIAPGWIHVREDEVLRPEDHAFHPLGRVGTPEDIARMCLFLCDPQNDFINGQTLTVDGGATVKMIYPEWAVPDMHCLNFPDKLKLFSVVKKPVNIGLFGVMVEKTTLK